jgi:hypothetical protein
MSSREAGLRRSFIQVQSFSSRTWRSSHSRSSTRLHRHAPRLERAGQRLNHPKIAGCGKALNPLCNLDLTLILCVLSYGRMSGYTAWGTTLAAIGEWRLERARNPGNG